MKIATVGKGGSGKTTIAGTLARLLGQKTGKVLAIDGDTNPNLALVLGLSPEQADAITAPPARDR
jgi:CO dehydrogenase maturation factor